MSEITRYLPGFDAALHPREGEEQERFQTEHYNFSFLRQPKNIKVFGKKKRAYSNIHS